MPVGVKLFKNDRLIQARAARGLTAVSLSALAEISTASISLYEKGVQKPQQEVLDKLAEALKVPVGYFFNEIGIDRPNKVFYRSMSSATKSARSRIQAQYEWALEIIEYLLRYFDFPKLNLPDLDIPKDFRQLDSNTIESIASQVRAHWNLGDGPVTNMIRTLESNGIVTWRTEFEAKTLDAFSEFRTPHPVIVLSSDKENYFRSRFDAAHELGHIILHRNIDRSILNKSLSHKILEDQAHYFAGAFLLPAISYSRDLVPSIDFFRSLKPKWNVSISMQIMRCRHLHLIDENREKSLWVNLSRRKWRKIEPLDDSTRAEKPNLISKSIEMLIDERVKHKEQIAQDLHLSGADLEKISELPLGYIRNAVNSDGPMLKESSSKVVPFKR